jgi:hypothetical protein
MKTYLLKTTILSLGLSLIFGFTSCKKDGVYHPKKKISKIFNQRSGYNKTLDETWTWDKNQLSKIDYGKGSYQKFEYDKKRISKIIDSDGEYMRFIYDGSKISRIEYYDEDNTLDLNIKFEHKGNKISKITEEYYYNYDPYSSKSAKKKTSILRFILPEKIAGDIAAFKSQKKNRKAIETDISTYVLTWKGDNIEKIVYENIDEEDHEVHAVTYKYTYDKKKNPFCEFLYEWGDPLGSSKNNVTKESVVDSDNYFWECESSYTYDKNYPKEITSVYRYDGSYTSTYVTFYEYED